MEIDPLTPAAIGGFVKMAVDALRSAFPGLINGGRAQFVALILSAALAAALYGDTFRGVVGALVSIFSSAIAWNETTRLAAKSAAKIKERKEERFPTTDGPFQNSPGAGEAPEERG